MRPPLLRGHHRAASWITLRAIPYNQPSNPEPCQLNRSMLSRARAIVSLTASSAAASSGKRRRA
jgi:hypothetical protein